DPAARRSPAARRPRSPPRWACLAPPAPARPPPGRATATARAARRAAERGAGSIATSSRTHPSERAAQEESKPDSVAGGHLSGGAAWRPPRLTTGAPYPGLGEQRQRPCLGLQRGGLPLFTPA